MTALELLKKSLALLGRDPADTADYETAALYHINTLLAELFDANNAMLLSDGGTALENIPALALSTGQDLDDLTIPYGDALARNVMPWGLARLLALPENNPNVGYFNNTYEENRMKAAPCLDGISADAYGGEEE